MSLKLRKTSALNLCLEGSTGSFNVGSGRSGQNSIEVKFLLTHVGLDFSGGSNEALLSHLAPVREIFPVKQLSFDEIMQRDIDDARVSSELIPYILDKDSSDLVKLFPPIVVVLLPSRENEDRPDDLYPEIDDGTVDRDGQPTYILRSGKVGEEVFQFEQPKDGEKTLDHDLVRLKLNTYKTKLVIVDGQHRAMALLAIYRNLKGGWEDERRSPFEDYYSMWTKSYIQQFNLKKINLPILLCTLPSLNVKEYDGEFDLKKASRSIFLTLNKTARSVSNSRNILLDDNDIIASFLRRSLSSIKDKDRNSSFYFRIHNVELDQAENKIKIQNSIAITGVNHLYYMIEHLLLNKRSDYVSDRSGSFSSGVKQRSGYFGERENLEKYGLMFRLNGRDQLGKDSAESTTRKKFTSEAELTLGRTFDEKYGQFIVGFFEKFTLFEKHNEAVFDLETAVDRNKDRKLKPILFDGQGISRVFEKHREALKKKLREEPDFYGKSPEIQENIKRLDNTDERIKSLTRDFHSYRAKLCIKSIPNKAEFKISSEEMHPKVVSIFNDFFDDIITTVAFQSGVICTFFGEVERAEIDIIKSDSENLNRLECFDEYIENLNAFFCPSTVSQFKKLVKTFFGDFSGPMKEWSIIKTNQMFREIVSRGEMQPDQWTSYRYLMLEIWRPTNEFLARAVSEETERCRKQVFRSLFDQYKRTYCRENAKIELDETERSKIFEKSLEAYKGFLSALNAEGLDRESLRASINSIPDEDYGDEEG